MKKLPLIFSGVALAAVVLLFVLEFTDKDEISENRGVVGSVATGGIAYVNIDSIIYNFDMYFELRDELIKKQEGAEAELNSGGSRYETQAKDYEEKVRKGLVTRATAAQMEQDLIQQQQQLVNLRDQLQYDLMEEEQVMNRRILEYIYEFLEAYTEDNNYEYILGKSFGGPVLYSKSSLDITADVLQGINKYYVEKKK